MKVYPNDTLPNQANDFRSACCNSTVVCPPQSAPVCVNCFESIY